MFVKDKQIAYIDVLKIDTEGFEMEVLKGANECLIKEQIGMIFMEVNFANSHIGAASFVDLYQFPLQYGFELITIYPIVHRKNKAVYTNILFKHKNY